MKKLITIIIVLLMSSTVLAHGSAFGVDEETLVGMDLPRGMRSLFGDQRVNIFITLDSEGEEIHGLVTQNGVITDFSNEELDKPTLIVKSSESVILNIMSADNIVNELQSALRDGRITYRAVGIINKIKFGFVGVFARVAGWFDNSDNSPTGNVVVNVPGRTEVKLNEVSREKEVSRVNEGVVEEGVTDGPKTHKVQMTRFGFAPELIEINTGDKVLWEMERTSPSKGMVVGVRTCRGIKSELLYSGDTYEYTFYESGECTVVDGIMTTKVSKVTVN
jgi:plastocyanin